MLFSFGQCLHVMQHDVCFRSRIKDVEQPWSAAVVDDGKLEAMPVREYGKLQGEAAVIFEESADLKVFCQVAFQIGFHFMPFFQAMPGVF